MGVTVAPMALGKGQVIKTIHGHRYLYQRYPFWNKEKHRKDDKWRSLGRCDEQGNLLATAKPASRPDVVHASTPVGELAVFWAAAQELDLVAHATRALGDPHAARLVVALALNHVAGRRALDHVPSWLKETPVGQWLNLNPDLDRADLDAALSALCHQDEHGTTRDQGLVLQKALNQQWRADSREPAQFYYDVTKVVYNGSSLDLAEPGYHPRATQRNVVGFGLVTSRTHHHPVLCQPIYGSRNDTVEDTVQTLHAFGYDHLTMILDRGMVSQTNLDFLTHHGHHQVGIVPASNKDAWDYLAKHAPTEVEKARNVTLRPTGLLYARAWNAKLLGRTMRLAVAVDPLRRAREQVNRDALLYEAETTTDPKRLQEIRRALGSLTTTTRGRRGWTIDPDAVKEDSKGDGRFLLFSTDTKMTAQDMIRVYFQREHIERCFRLGKGRLGLEPIRYHRLDRVHAHATLVYLAWLLWSWAERHLHEKSPRMSLDQALATLESVHLVTFASQNTLHRWPTRLNDEQEKLLKQLGALKTLDTLRGGY